MRNRQIPPAFAVALVAGCLLVAGAAAQDSPTPLPNDPVDRGAEAPVPADPQRPGPNDADPQAVDPESAGRDPAESDAKAPPLPGKRTAEPAVPKDRDTMLAELYAHLAKAPDAEQAAPIAKTIEGLWLHSGSDTIGVLMRRALQAVADQRTDLALKLLDAIVDLAPDYAEGWSRRAYVYYLQNDVEHAAGDLRRALALEPNHYKALEGLARILRENGQKKAALRAYQQLLRINPNMPGAKDAASELSLEVEGQGI